MKLKSVLLLAVAMSCGLVAMLGVQQVLSGDKQVNQDDNVTKVLVATAEIVPGHRLDESNVVFKLVSQLPDHDVRDLHLFRAA